MTLISGKGGRMELSEKLKTTRSILKLTLEAVSERSGIGVSTLSEFETGRREPRLGQLKQLADAYHRQVSFFLEDSPQAAECILWRQRPESPNVEELQATLLDLAEKYHTLEMLCDQHTNFELPSVSVAAERFDYRAAGGLARRVRNELGLGERPGQTLLRVLGEVCNVRVFHLDFEPSGSAACTLSQRFGAGILLNSKNVRWRRNFDLAHEFFHLLTWRVFRHDCGEQPKTPSDHEEKLATCFARNLLMPEEVFREAVDKQQSETGKLGFDGLYEVAREFDVSVEAVLWQIGFVYNISSEKVQATVSALREQSGCWDVREKDAPPSRPLRFEALARQALRKGLLSTGKYAEYVGVTRREAMRLVEREATEDVQVEVTHP
jgi:XRE family transcriptional regulator, fatty acid utilization regulator